MNKKRVVPAVVFVLILFNALYIGYCRDTGDKGDDGKGEAGESGGPGASGGEAGAEGGSDDFSSPDFNPSASGAAQRDPNVIDGDYSDQYIRALQARGRRIIEDLKRRYHLFLAKWFNAGPYSFNNIRDSVITLNSAGRLLTANITSDIGNNTFRFLNPVAHIKDEQNITSYALSDADSDGLSDIAEKRLYTDPDKVDTDSDGLTDAEERLIYGTDPQKADSIIKRNGVFIGEKDYIDLMQDVYAEWLDTGQDVIQGVDTKLIPYFEYMHFNDTDGDGLSDYTEAAYGLDIYNPDTDSDGLTDFYEVSVTASSPLIADTDGDGKPDGIEPFPFSLINDGDFVHLLRERSDTLLTIIADENEAYQLEMKENLGDITKQGFSITTYDDIDVFIGSTNAKLQFSTGNSTISDPDLLEQFNSQKESVINFTKTATGYSIGLQKAVMHTTDNEEFISSNLSVINVSIEDDIECMQMSPISRYSYYGSENSYGAYSIYENNDTFTTCIRKVEEQHYDMDLDNCRQCGYIDFVRKNKFFRGIFEYEKEMEGFSAFSDAIESGSNNTYNLSYDSNLSMIKHGDLNINAGSVLHTSFFRILNTPKTFFDLLRSPAVQQTTESFTTNIDNATIAVTRNETVVTHRNGGVFRMIAEKTPEYDALLKKMRDFRK